MSNVVIIGRDFAAIHMMATLTALDHDVEVIAEDGFKELHESMNTFALHAPEEVPEFAYVLDKVQQGPVYGPRRKRGKGNKYHRT